MIYGNSTDPILLKKIYLNIWTLKDEIYSVIGEAYRADPKSFDENTIKKIVKDYESLGKIKKVQDKEPDKSESHQKDGAAEEEAGETGEAGEAGEAEEVKDDAREEATEESAEGDGGADEEEGSSEIPESKKAKEFLLLRDKPPLDKEHYFRGMCILNDVNMEEIVFFSESGFILGQSILLQFIVTNQFIISGEVVRCNHFHFSSRIISPRKLAYRVRVKFKFESVGERTLLRNFLESISSNDTGGRGANEVDDENEDMDEEEDEFEEEDEEVA